MKRTLAFLGCLVAMGMPARASALDPFTDGSDNLGNNALTSGVALAIADMNGDCLDDIIRMHDTEDLEIEYQQEDGTFQTYVFGYVPEYSWSMAIGDVDGNGYNDVYVGGAYDGRKIILANDDGTDYELTYANGPDGGIFSQCANFVDIDNNGTLDLFVCHDDGVSAAYNGDGTGALTYDLSLINAESTAPSDNSGNYGSVWTDYDSDGDLDLYIAKCRLFVNNGNDGRRTNLLFQNDGAGNFTEVAPAAGLQPLAQSWAIDFGDIDNDGDFDAILLNHDMNSILYRNDGDGGGGTDVFTDITVAAGIENDLFQVDLGIQTFFEDFDNDGFLDIMVTGREGQHRLLMNDGDGTFTAESNPFPTGGPGIHSASVGDLNNDGFPDILAGFATGFNNPSSNPDKIFLNPGNDNNWVNILLRGTTSNANGVGARVEIEGAWGTQTREVRAGQSYGIGLSFTNHFGLGTETGIDTVTITWPSGQVDTFDDPEINRVLHVTEGCPDTYYADVDGDGFGDPDAALGSCYEPTGYVTDNTDCADDDENNYPDNAEVCDGFDNNCNDEVDEGLDDCMVGDTGADSGDTDSADSADAGDGTGGPSTSGPSTTMPATTDPGDGSAGSDDSTGTMETGDPGGCGCGIPSTPAGPMALLLVLLGLRRRRDAA